MGLKEDLEISIGSRAPGSVATRPGAADVTHIDGRELWTQDSSERRDRGQEGDMRAGYRRHIVKALGQDSFRFSHKLQDSSGEVECTSCACSFTRIAAATSSARVVEASRCLYASEPCFCDVSR